VSIECIVINSELTIQSNKFIVRGNNKWIDFQKFSLGVKQLTTDPWDEAASKYPVGTKGSGIITKTTDFGAFVQITENVEGMIHLSEK